MDKDGLVFGNVVLVLFRLRRDASAARDSLPSPAVETEVQSQGQILGAKTLFFRADAKTFNVGVGVVDAEALCRSGADAAAFHVGIDAAPRGFRFDAATLEFIVADTTAGVSTPSVRTESPFLLAAARGSPDGRTE